MPHSGEQCFVVGHRGRNIWPQKAHARSAVDVLRSGSSFTAALPPWYRGYAGAHPCTDTSAEQPAAPARFSPRATTMNDVFPEPIRGWLERSPKAQRAVTRLRADLDALVARLESVIPATVRDAVAARIDPPSTAPAAAEDSTPAMPEGPEPLPPGAAR
jgi:hypothetical protein